MGAPLRHRGPVRSVAFSPDGRTVLTGSNDGAAQIWEVASQQPLGEPLRHKGWVQQVAFRPEGNVAITAGRRVDNTVRLWDLRNPAGDRRPLHSGGTEQPAGLGVRLLRQRESILTTGSWRSGRQNVRQVWDATNGRASRLRCVMTTTSGRWP